MNWKKIGGPLFTALKIMVPKIQEVQDDITAATKPGADKKAAVLKAVFDGISASEDLTGKHLAANPKFQQALGKVNDAIVEAHKVAEEVTKEFPHQPAGD